MFFTTQGTAFLRLTPVTDALDRVLSCLPHTTNYGQSRVVSTPHSCTGPEIPQLLSHFLLKKKIFQAVVKRVCPELMLEVAEGPSFQLGSFACPVTEKQEGVTGSSKHNNLALAHIPRLNCQLLFKRALSLDERGVCAVAALSNVRKTEIISTERQDTCQFRILTHKFTLKLLNYGK